MENIKISKNNKKGVLIVKRLDRSGEENKQPTIKEDRIKNLLLLIIY
jgi:hypothetical protein